ncbi:MAG: hypothetical protein LBB12_03440 [Holosporaceae bacterium]|jgi:hypothetical protein|nr:hypothetical protein [Holosporaceae bacterium]
MNEKKIACCILCSIFLCDYTYSNEQVSKYWVGHRRIAGAKNISFPEFTNPDELRVYRGNINKVSVLKRPFLNSDCTWTLKEDSGPVSPPVIQGVKKRFSDTLGELPDVIVIPTGYYYNTYPSGYPTNACHARFNYCPPESETPKGYKIRCLSESLRDYCDDPGCDYFSDRLFVQPAHMKLPPQSNYCNGGLDDFVFVYVRDDIPGAAQDDAETLEALEKARNHKCSPTKNKVSLPPPPPK